MSYNYQAMQSESQQDVFDLYCLIERFLSAGPFRNLGKALQEELSSNEIVPRRRDWRGAEHNRNYRDLCDHIPSNHLQLICKRLNPLLNQHVSKSIFTNPSLLTLGRRNSLLRNKETVCETIWRSKQFSASVNGRSLSPPFNLKSYNRIPSIRNREHGQRVLRNCLVPITLYKNMRMQLRCLGHLSSVYCVLFDRTGSKIFTGSDDCLIKCWCVFTAKLLFTFRGHQAEICDMDISFDNTLLAAASCNKIIRVWNLQSAAPVAILQGHSATLTALEFSPVIQGDVRFLLSTSRDGNVCFWQYSNISKEFDKQPIKFQERNRPGVSMLCSSWSCGGRFAVVGASDTLIHVYYIDPDLGRPYKLSELSLHKDKVDSIWFSHQGLMFASGSCDGTTRIWSFHNKDWECLTLNVAKNSNYDTTSGIGISKTKVVMVVWDCYDMHVVTSLTDFTIKVWRRNNGDLVNILKGHTEEAFCLESHPKDERLILSAGHDGNIILWDIFSGNQIMKYYNSLIGQGHGAIFDAKFSPEGHHIVCTDSHGHLIIFSYGDGESYRKVPDEQFFHTDYRPLIHDSFGSVLDEQTQQAPHRMPPPFLVDVDGNPHPAHLQRLVPGRENLTNDALIPIVAIAENGLSEVIGGEDTSLSATSEDGNNFMQEILSTSSTSHPPPPPIVPPLLPPPALASPIRNLPLGLRREGEVAGVRQMHPNAPRSQMASAAELTAIGHRVLVPMIPESNAKQTTKFYKVHGDYEVNLFNVKPSQQKISYNKISPTKTKTNKQKTNPAKNLNFYREDNDITSEESLSSSEEKENLNNSRKNRRINRLTARQRHSYGTRANIMQDSDNDFDDSMSETSNRSSISIGNNNSDFSLNDSSDDEAVNSDSFLANKSLDESHQLSDHHNTDQDEVDLQPKNVKESSEISKISIKTSYGSQMKCPFSLIPGVLPPDEYLPPKWITQNFPRPSPYLPQINDKIVYIKKGHQLYVKVIEEKKIWEIGNLDDICYNKYNLRAIEFCRVVGLDFEVGPPTLCHLKLQRTDSDDFGEKVFHLRFHDLADVIDFLVLRKQYESSISRGWTVGDRFRSVIDEAWWYGDIIKHTQSEENDYFQCFSVKWDSQEIESMSPWDLEEIPEYEINRNPRETEQYDGHGIPIDDEEMLELFRSYPLPHEWWEHCDVTEDSVHVVDKEISRIENGFNQILLYEMFSPFFGPVDLKVYPTYVLAVPYPLDLGLIMQRLSNRFYRQQSALEWDIELLAKNALAFNKIDSKIVKTALCLKEILIQFVKDQNCEDIAKIITEKTFVNQSLSPTTSKQRQNTSRKMSKDDPVTPDQSKRRNNKMKEEIASSSKKNDVDSWKESCSELLTLVWDTEDASPFRDGVDEDIYPDYFDYVDTPMDLRRIREKLAFGNYENPENINNDLVLMFRNSKTYNTNKKSKIYSMTVRLQALICDRMKPIIQSWKKHLINSQKLKINLRSSSRIRKPKELSPPPQPAVPRHNGRILRRTRRRVIMTSSTSSAHADDQPCTSKTIRTRSRKMTSSEEEEEELGMGGARKRKRNFAFIDESSDDNNNEHCNVKRKLTVEGESPAIPCDFPSSRLRHNENTNGTFEPNNEQIAPKRILRKTIKMESDDVTSVVTRNGRTRRRKNVCYVEVNSSDKSDESDDNLNRHQSVSSRGRIRKLSTKALESRTTVLT